MKVLVIEDSPSIHRAYERILKRWFPDVDVWISDNADLAISYIGMFIVPLRQAHGAPLKNFDLIISDYNLHGDKTGGDVLAWIKANRPELAARFLFVSTDPKIFELHDTALEKPATPDQLRKEIFAMQGF
jgi:CheY-like chemotaxis protein